jgi:hypothetical protein
MYFKLDVNKKRLFMAMTDCVCVCVLNEFRGSNMNRQFFKDSYNMRFKEHNLLKLGFW